ncbi:hypothetical protein ACLQ3H_17100 [Micromonospora saelicesensis]|uniref:Uncharacterized protein n=1 Tax=Micromonospora saelicesensis TaxID=285676 RepID=A0ABX9CN35_9ACTN|nr:hypothetical protein [Micromonospora saelicesensis]RAO01931.1 hypothetical protein GAR05_01539 [Micromonospora saelicesensis]
MLLLSFAAVLLVAVLLSALAHRTILSTAALFLVAGFILGEDTTGQAAAWFGVLHRVQRPLRPWRRDRDSSSADQ